MKRIFLALGSNLGNREDHLRQAIEKLQSSELQVLRVSPVYETAPQGFLNQDWFLNLVLEAETSLLPMRLLTRCQQVERTLKRHRQVENGPRTIDIDILFYGGAVIHSSRLEVPHPRYSQRRFVLEPLAALAPDLRDPVTKRSVREMLAPVADQIVQHTDLIISTEPPPS